MPTDNAPSNSPNSSPNAQESNTPFSQLSPKLKIIAGPNGAGKSTFAEATLVGLSYINGDEIKRLAKINNGIRMDTFSLRIHIRELINQHVSERKSFALESNLVSNYSYDIVRDLADKGYFTELLYIGVDDERILNERIAERVKLGKHYVSPADVSQRYRDSLSKLPVNLKFFNEAVLVDNTNYADPKEVLQLQDGIIVSKAYVFPGWLEKIFPAILRLSNAYETVRKRHVKTS